MLIKKFLFNNIGMKEIWNKLDLNRDGVVKTAEVDVFLKNLNSTLSDEDRKEIIKLIDKYILFQHQKKNFFNKKLSIFKILSNCNGRVEFIELVRAYKQGILSSYNI